MTRLCDFHATVIANLARHDNVGDRDSERAAASVARQCPTCVTPPKPNPHRT